MLEEVANSGGGNAFRRFLGKNWKTMENKGFGPDGAE